MRSHFRKNPCHQRTGKGMYPGFSLLEVMIATAIFSLGLAGFATLLLSNMVSSAHARNASAISIAATQLAEQIRLNPDQIERYITPPEYIERICTGDASCSPWQQADFDFRLWQIELGDRVPGARAVVCRDESPEDGSLSDPACDGTGALLIKIFWPSRATETSIEGETNRYVLPLS